MYIKFLFSLFYYNNYILFLVNYKYIFFFLFLTVVALLRGLFVNLMHTQHKSISPDIDLAYLALVNAKSEEEEYRETSKSPMDLSSTSYDNKMAVDDSSPGPSSTKIADNAMTSDSTSYEEEIVLEEGMSANSKNEDASSLSIENLFQSNES